MNIKLYKPTTPQVDFHKLVHEDKAFISAIVAGRQRGKTFLMQNDCVLRAINNPKHRMFWVSPIQDQANKVMKDIEAMFSGHQEVWNKIVKRYDRKANELYFYNGSFIQWP